MRLSFGVVSSDFVNKAKEAIYSLNECLSVNYMKNRHINIRVYMFLENGFSPGLQHGYWLAHQGIGIYKNIGKHTSYNIIFSWPNPQQWLHISSLVMTIQCSKNSLIIIELEWIRGKQPHTLHKNIILENDGPLLAILTEDRINNPSTQFV